MPTERDLAALRRLVKQMGPEWVHQVVDAGPPKRGRRAGVVNRHRRLEAESEARAALKALRRVREGTELAAAIREEEKRSLVASDPQSVRKRWRTRVRALALRLDPFVEVTVDAAGRKTIEIKVNDVDPSLWRVALLPWIGGED